MGYVGIECSGHVGYQVEVLRVVVSRLSSAMNGNRRQYFRLRVWYSTIGALPSMISTLGDYGYSFARIESDNQR